MGNHQIHPKRQSRPSESVEFNKNEISDEHFVTINKGRIFTVSAPPFEEHSISIPSIDESLITFTTAALPFDTHASVIGTFNHWTEQKMIKSDGQYQLCLRIPYGCHYYKILVNDRPRFQNHETIESHHQYGQVHYLYVGAADHNVNNHLEPSVLCSPKLNPWSQEIDHSVVSNNHPPPPRIPPHLLNILLNRKLPVNCAPHVLPEPNSVTLRHLYALSIQNGIMILSTTLRYKHKFVTVCFYKPN